MLVDVVAALVCVVVGSVLLGRMSVLARAPSPGAVPPGSVSIVIPARNERESLPELLSSLRHSDVAPLEVIVVDDGSTDGTAAVAASLGATVLDAPPPPEGWNGKPWACWTGAARARGEHVLFLDADVTLAPDALRRLCASYDRGLLSVQPFHRPVSNYESLSGWFNVVSMMGTGAFAVLPRDEARRDRNAIAFGPCLLTSVSDYRAVDGHRAVRDAIVEDAALAERYTEHGLPVRCFGGGDAVAFRMYPDGIRSLLDGWTRTLAAGSGAARRLPVMAAVAWVAACGTVVVGAVQAALDGFRPVPLALYALVAAVVGVLQARVGRFRWWSWVLFPIPLACFLAVFARSLWCLHVRREVVWRSRRVQLHDSAAGDPR